MGWKFKEGTPIWQQIMDILCQRIVRGDWPPGSRVSAVRELALDAGVNPNTMQRALSERKREGLLYSERTSGRFVTRDEAVLKKLREDMSTRYIEDLFSQLERLGMSPEEILEILHKYAEQKK